MSIHVQPHATQRTISPARRKIKYGLLIAALVSLTFTSISCTPSEEPATTPSEEPATTPSEEPATTPSEEPATTPSEEPATTPSEEPATTPSEEPATTPSEEPATTPSEEPATTPSEEPATTPSEEPATTPSEEPATTPSEELDYSMSSVDLSADKLPPKFAGHDPEYIYKTLASRFRPKGEFETTPEFEERLRTDQEKPLVGDLTIHCILASTYCADSGRGRKILYDADRRVLQISPQIVPTTTRYLVDQSPPLEQELEQKEEVHTVELKQIVDDKGVYVGSNAYGVKRDIHQVDEYNYLLIFNNFEDFGLVTDNYYRATLEVPMDADTAKVAKSHLRTMFLYRLVSPVIKIWTYTRRPEIDDPRDGDCNRYYLNAMVEEIWLYDFETGEIYKKLKPVRKSEADAEPEVKSEKDQETAKLIEAERERQKEEEALKPKFRTWKDKTGQHQIEGKFVSLSAGKVKLELKDEKVIAVEVDALCEADKEYIEERKKIALGRK